LTPLRDKFLHAVQARSVDHPNKGRACLALGEFLLVKSEIVASQKGPSGEDAMKRVRTEPPHRLPEYEQLLHEDPVVLAHEGERMLERTIAECRELRYDPIFLATDGKTLAGVARTELRRHRNLAIGKEAPEIEGQDVEGRPFKIARLPRPRRPPDILGELVWPLSSDVSEGASTSRAAQGACTSVPWRTLLSVLR